MIDRYKVTVSNVQATAHGAAHPDGEYVKFTDYDALRSRLAAAEGLLDRVPPQVTELFRDVRAFLAGAGGET